MGEVRHFNGFLFVLNLSFQTFVMDFVRFIAASFVMLVIFSCDTGRRANANNELKTLRAREQNCNEELKKVIALSEQLKSQNELLVKKNQALTDEITRMRQSGFLLFWALEGRAVLRNSQIDSL